MKSDQGIDLIGHRKGEHTILVESKIYSQGRKVGVDAVRSLIAAAQSRKAEGAIVVSSSGFSSEAMNLARQQAPLNLQLMDFQSIRQWAEGLHAPDDKIAAEVAMILRQTSEKLARLIAQDRRALVSMEWRDMERLMAEVFDGIGFNAELTPPSKDGGKDVIITCQVKGKEATYYVEVKHWRSSTKVGSGAVQDLLNIVVSQSVSGDSCCRPMALLQTLLNS